jgi:gas vesicle protein
MADGYDRFDNEAGGGGSFVMGLLTGTVLGAGLGMLFAPKAGSELRNQLSEQAGNLANQASEGYRKASETATQWADKAREAVNKGADEAQRYVREATGSAPTPTTTPSSMSSSSTYGSSESLRGSSPETIRSRS